mgnify:CR=1 FL=1
MEKRILVYYICDKCHYQFESELDTNQCPDCGKHKVREATEAEIKEYLNTKADL